MLAFIFDHFYGFYFHDVIVHLHVVCDAGTYGVNCHEECSGLCEDNSCDHKDGTCSCTTWGIGEKCGREIGKPIRMTWLVRLLTDLTRLILTILF